MTEPLTEKETKLVSILLDRASDQFGQHCCNDCDDEWFKGWTEEEKISLDKKIHELNGDPEEHDPDCISFSDWILMWYFSKRMR
jgi:hypothetical protein